MNLIQFRNGLNIGFRFENVSPSVSKAASYSYYASDRKQRLQRIFVELEQRYKSEGHDLR